MKKRFLCVLSLVLALMLCGCDSASALSDSPETTAAPTILSENAEGEIVALEYDFAVQMTLQSDYTLYLNNDMTLVALEAAVEDGKALPEGLEIAGKPYAEGMELILNAALEQGILADQGKVSFSVTCDIFSMELMETLITSVMEFEKNTGIFVFIDWNLIPIEEPDFEANYLYGLQKIKGKNQTIYVEKANWINPVSGEQTVYSYFSKFPDPSVYDLGSVLIGSNLDAIRIKMLYFNADGSISVTHFKDGHLTKSLEISGVELQAYEYENNKISIDIHKFEDGSYSFFKFAGLNELNGQFIGEKSFGCWTDGTRYVQNTCTYHSNGNAAIMEEIGSDGSFYQRTYDENGNEIHTYLTFKSADGTFSEAEFENGEAVYEKTVYPDGTYMEGHYENGNWTYTKGIIEATDPED